jgi:hypothetical protein
MALRPLLSELGCLPISKLTGYPSVSAVRQQMCWLVRGDSVAPSVSRDRP